jgi:hypothetical protein
MDYILHNPKSQRKSQYNDVRNVLHKCVNYSACCVDEDRFFDEVSERGSSVSDEEGGSSASEAVGNSSAFVVAGSSSDSDTEGGSDVIS